MHKNKRYPYLILFFLLNAPFLYGSELAGMGEALIWMLVSAISLFIGLAVLLWFFNESSWFVPFTLLNLSFAFLITWIGAGLESESMDTGILYIAYLLIVVQLFAIVIAAIQKYSSGKNK